MSIKDFFHSIFHREKPVKVNLRYPVSWEEMTDQQFREVCNILSLPGIGRERALFLCLCRLAGIHPDNPAKYNPKKIKGLQPFIIDGKTYTLTARDVAAACEDLAYIYDSVGLAPAPFDKIDRMLYGVSFEAFYTADSFIGRAVAENNEKYLKEAAKYLTSGRIRKLLPWQKKGLGIWWNGVKHWMMGKYPHVLKEGGSVTDRTQAEILQDLLSCMNGNRPQENEKILKTDVHSVLYSLNKIYENADKRVLK